MAFGSFDDICTKVAFPLCSVIAPAEENPFFPRGIIPQCYAISVDIANTMIFQIGNAFIHFGGLIIVLICIFNVRAKYTAIGRTEMLSFFYIIIALLVSSLVVDCGVSPPSSASYPYFVALQIGLASATCMCLLYNGILTFQFWEDGTRTSMWSLRIVTFAWFAANFIISLITFQSWNTSLSPSNTMLLFIFTYVLNAVILFIYLVSQIILVIFALRNYWLLGALSVAVFFFVLGQICCYVISVTICNGTGHYLDGLFFASLGNLFTIMMIYKFWDMITSDDLEFSVANVETGVNSFGEEEKRNSTFFG